MTSAVHIALLAFTLLLCVGNASADWSYESVDGSRVEIKGNAERIVSLSPGVTEVLFALGGSAKVVGVSEYCDTPVAAKLKTKVGQFNQPDLKKVAATDPDIVLFTEYIRQEDSKALDAAGIPYAILHASSFADLLDWIRAIGALLGEPEAGIALAGRMEDKVRGIGEQLARLKPEELPTVYIEVDGPRTLYGVGEGSFMDDLIRLAGGRNVFGRDKPAYFKVEPSEVVAVDPDVIFVDHPFQFKVGVSKRPGWSAIKAVREGRVFDSNDYDFIMLNRPGPRIGDSIEEVAGMLHPEVFGE